MPTLPLELEGTLEDIQKRLAEFAGQRLYVMVKRAETPNGEGGLGNRSISPTS